MVWVIVSGAVFLAVGLALGSTLRRQAGAAKEAEAREAAERELIAAREQLRARGEQLDDLRRGLAAVQERAAADQERLVALTGELARAGADLAAERRAAAERAAEAERTREQVRAEIEVLAGRLLDEKGKLVLDESREGLQAILSPLREKLKEFEAKVDKTYDQENRDRAALLQALRQMQETQKKLHEDAGSLARALTGESKAQGDWGELVLERIFETAGLTEGREYALQVNHVDEEGGRRRPDALVYLPANRAVVVDAKCSLTAFVRSTRTLDAGEREASLDAHLASVRAHVKSLASKSYQDVLKQRTLDIVFMFVPNEAAFHAAIARDVGLYEEAFRQRVVICSPTTLLAALQLVGHVWRSEKQNANAQRIADEAGKLLDKLAAFVEDLDGVGARLEQARASMGAARGKLVSGRGNLVERASKIVKLGARVKSDKAKELLLDAAQDEVEEVVEGSGEPFLVVSPSGRSSGGAPVA